MKTYDLVGIGNAVVDVISHSDDAFLDNMGIEKGIMQLVPQDRAEQLYAAMDDRVQTPGGAVANTVAGVGALGLNTAFIGRVRDDGLGRFYAKAMTDNGIDFVNVPVTDGDTPTSRSMIFVTPDGERSMNTYLGISTGLSSADVPALLLATPRSCSSKGISLTKTPAKPPSARPHAQPKRAAAKQALQSPIHSALNATAPISCK